MYENCVTFLGALKCNCKYTEFSNNKTTIRPFKVSLILGGQFFANTEVKPAKRKETSRSWRFFFGRGLQNKDTLKNQPSKPSCLVLFFNG